MREHAEGVETAMSLERRLRDRGVVYQLFEGNGFVVVGDRRVFVVREPHRNSVEGFAFKEVHRDDVELFKIEEGRPADSRYVEGTRKPPDRPLTHIRLWLPSDAIDCVVDGDPRVVASAFVTLTEDDDFAGDAGTAGDDARCSGTTGDDGRGSDRSADDGDGDGDGGADGNGDGTGVGGTGDDGA